MTKQQTFVFENTEVVKTGRTAGRTLTSGNVITLVEITPADPTLMQWKKWVREADLFVVSD